MEQKHILAIFIIGIMVLSALGFVINFTVQGPEAPGKQEFNGVTFKQTAQGWKAKIDSTEWEFFSFPEQVQGWSLPQEALL